MNTIFGLKKLKRQDIKINGIIFAGEIQPYDIKNNIQLLKIMAIMEFCSGPGIQLMAMACEENQKWMRL